MTGVVDVRNEFGDTTLTLGDSFDDQIAHRVLSESGAIVVRGDAKLFKRINLYANTLCGSFFTNLDQKTLEEQSVSFRTGQRPRRNWNGLLKPQGPKGMGGMGMFFGRRAPQALENENRSPGLDLISRGGSLQILDSAK